MNNLDKQYQSLLQDILDNGIQKTDRTGTGTLSLFGKQIRHKMSEGFPLLTTKKMAWKTIVTELLWFLRGETNIKYLVDNDCHIWDGDAFKNYIKHNPNCDKQMLDDAGQMVNIKDWFINKIKTDDEFAKQWGELGPIYGKQWRSWEVDTSYLGNDEWTQGKDIDQIANLISELKTNPDSRRLMVNAWNVGELDAMVLPPCHYGFQVYTRELSLSERYDIMKNGDLNEWLTVHYKEAKTMEYMDKHNIPKRAISLMWNQRSVDTFLGLPFNIASYGLLLEIIAKIVNMVPDELIGNLGDVHLYSNHIEQAKEQIGRELTLEERMDLHKKYITEDKLQLLFEVGTHENLDILGVPKRTREPFDLPTFKLPKTDAFWNVFDMSLITHLDPEDFTIQNYQSHPAIKAPLSN